MIFLTNGHAGGAGTASDAICICFDRDYQTGTELHIEWAGSKIFANGLSIGLAGYHYQQLTGDSGDDARLGDFEGHVTAIGPVLGATVPLGDRALTARLSATPRRCPERQFRCRDRRKLGSPITRSGGCCGTLQDAPIHRIQLITLSEGLSPSCMLVLRGR